MHSNEVNYLHSKLLGKQLASSIKHNFFSPKDVAYGLALAVNKLLLQKHFQERQNCS